MSFGHQFCQREGIMAEHIDMSVAKRGEACDIFIIQCFTLRPEMIQGCRLCGFDFAIGRTDF